MTTISRTMSGIVFVLSITAVALGEFQLVDNFDHYTIADLTRVSVQPPNGVLGGKWAASPSNPKMSDARIMVSDGNQVLAVRNQATTGQARAAMIYGLADPIDNHQTGVLFFRFRITSEGRNDAAAYAFAGLHDRTSATTRPSDISAGFGIRGDAKAERLEIISTEEKPAVLHHIRPEVWYSAWVVADNTTDTFDVYLSPEKVSGGAVVRPQQRDRIIKGQPFGAAANQPLQGAIFICPKAPAGTQTLQIDDIHWNGERGLGVPDDSTLPPNPMTWKTPPQAVRPTEITMTAAAAETEFEVEYFFENTAEPSRASGWQATPEWTETGLKPKTQYTYRVKARYTYANQIETQWSAPESVTTPEESDRQPPMPDPMVWKAPPGVVGYNFVTMAVAPSVDAEGSTPVQYYFANLTDPTRDSGWQNDTAYTDTGLLYDTEYSYRVKSRDASANVNESRWSPAVAVKTDKPPLLLPYLRKSLLQRFASLEAEVPLHIYFNQSSTDSQGAPLLFYVKNHGYPRIGQESDDSILKDYIDQGYLVITLDFEHNPAAVSPRFDADLWGVFRAAHGYRTTSLLEGTQLRPDADLYWFVPAGCRLVRNLPYFELDKHGAYGTKEHVLGIWNKYANKPPRNFPKLTNPDQMYNPNGSPLDWTLRMDIIYPSRPSCTLPLVVWASTQSKRHIGSPASFRPHFWGFLMRGYVFAMTDHCYVPLNRHWAYGHGFHPQYNLCDWNGVKAETAAIRYLRKNADQYGINPEYIGLWGHSKGSYTSALLANPDHIARGEVSAFKGFPEGSPEPQPWQGYSSQITASYQSMGGGTRNLTLVTEKNVPTVIACGEYDHFGEWNRFPPLVKAYQSLNLNHVALWMNGVGHELPHSLDPVLGIDRYATVHTFFDQYLKPDQSPQVLYILPINGREDVDLNGTSPAIPDKSILPPKTLEYMPYETPITVHFGQPMKRSSIDNNGIQIIRKSDNTPVAGRWTALRGNTVFQFQPAERLSPDTRYRVTVTTRVGNEKNIALSNEKSIEFKTAGAVK